MWIQMDTLANNCRYSVHNKKQLQQLSGYGQTYILYKNIEKQKYLGTVVHTAMYAKQLQLLTYLKLLFMAWNPNIVFFLVFTHNTWWFAPHLVDLLVETSTKFQALKPCWQLDPFHALIEVITKWQALKTTWARWGCGSLETTWKHEQKWWRCDSPWHTSTEPLLRLTNHHLSRRRIHYPNHK